MLDGVSLAISQVTCPNRTAFGSLNDVAMALGRARAFGYLTATDSELAANLAGAGRMTASLGCEAGRP